jgi:hypothetical protein
MTAACAMRSTGLVRFRRCTPRAALLSEIL